MTPSPIETTRRTKRRVAASLLSTALAIGASAQDTGLPEAFRIKTDLERPNTLLVADIVHDSTPELIATDVRGLLMVFDLATAASGNAIMEMRVSGDVALTGATAGNFMGRNTLDLVVGTEDGRVILIDGSSLAILSEYKIGDASINLLPTVFPVSDPADPSRTRDALLVCDQVGTIHGLSVSNGALAPLWEPIKTSSIASAPAAVGSVRQPGTTELIIPTRDGNVILLDPATRDAETIVVRENKPIEGTPLLIDVNGDGRDDMVFVFDNGDLWARSYVGRGKLLGLWQASTNAKPISDPVLVGTMDAGVANSLIFQAVGNSLVALDPISGSVRAKGEQRDYSGMNTRLAIIPKGMGFPLLALGVEKVLMIVDTRTWFAEGVPSYNNPTMTVGEELTNTLVAARVGTDLMVIGAGGSGRIVAVESGAAPIEQTGTPWMTRGGTPQRRGMIDLPYFEADAIRRGGLAQELARQKAALEAGMEAGEWQQALDAANWLTEFDPFDSEYAKLHQSIWLRKNMIWLILGGLVSLGALSGISIVAVRVLGVRRLESRAKAAVSKGKFDEGELLYEALHQKRPKDPKVVATLAMVYISKRNFSPKTIGTYAEAYAQDRENQNLLHSYARALLLSERTDAESRAVFESALKTFPEPPLLEYAIGMCHVAAHQWEEAGKRLRAALRGGLARENVYSALCDVYLETRNHSSKSLPVFKQQFPRRQEDLRFLEAYLEACMDAKQTDASVESLCHMVLELNPRNVIAYCHLASMYLQRNEVGRAIDEIKHALEVAPDSERAAAQLAYAYMLEGRTDADAQRALRRALEFKPEDPEFLRVLTEIYFQAGRYDTEAVDIYRRSYKQNPSDPTTLRALSQTARLTNDHDLAIRVIEALNHQGQSNGQFNVILANSYIAKNIYEARCEGAFREALRAEPNSPALTAGLARVLMLQGREDLEAIPVYERHIQSARDDREVGTQLIKAYIANHRYEDGLRLAQYLMKKAPDDHELKRLVALSSLYDNKIDEAVAEYQHILERNPDDHDALVHLALAYAQKGRTDEDAARLFARAIAAAPNNADLHLAMARVQLASGDSAKATESYQMALKVRPGTEDLLIRHISAALAKHPDAVRVRWFLCEVLVAHGHFREALEHLSAIYEGNPNYAGNLIGALDKILAKDPRNIGALAQKGRMLLATKDQKGARTVLEAAYALQPTNGDVIRHLTEVYEASLKGGEDAETRFRLGKLHYMNQEYDKAIGAFQKTAQDYRWEAESTKMLGKCFTAKGMLDLALQEFKKLVVDEETKDLLYDLAQRYEGKKDLVGAKTVYRQLFAADIDYKDVKSRFEMLSGSTSDPMAFEKTSVVQQMSESAQRRYELLDELGRGAMGIVYRARDKELDEVVALKILPDNMSNNPEAVHRFKIEARNARKLSHPNIVRIHDIGEEMGRKYISMEFVNGSDLKRKVKTEGRLDMKTIFHYGIQIADALAYAHRLGIVHRDIKPANIMLTSDNETKVTDFGIAKMLDQTGEGTMVGAVIGTPLYMSPEQVQGIPVDNRADIYAYGIMMYEFANGRPPFTEGDLAYQHMHRKPDKPEQCPDALWKIIAKCLEKRKEDRWEKAEMIVDALKEARRAVVPA